MSQYFAIYVCSWNVIFRGTALYLIIHLFYPAIHHPVTEHYFQHVVSVDFEFKKFWTLINEDTWKSLLKNRASYCKWVIFPSSDQEGATKKLFRCSPYSYCPWHWIIIIIIIIIIMDSCGSVERKDDRSLSGSKISLRYLCNKNQPDALSFLIYSNKYPPHVSKCLAIHPQEAVYCTCSLWHLSCIHVD